MTTLERKIKTNGRVLAWAGDRLVAHLST